MFEYSLRNGVIYGRIVLFNIRSIMNICNAHLSQTLNEVKIGDNFLFELNK